MKRYLIFAFFEYEPIGGWADFFGDYDTLKEARAIIELHEEDGTVWDIVDCETKKFIERI